MAKPYWLDLRERVLNDYDAGVPVEYLVDHYDISRSWTYSLIKQRKESGSIAPQNPRRGAKLKLAPYEQEVRQLVKDHPDAYPFTVFFPCTLNLVFRPLSKKIIMLPHGC